MLIKQLNVRFIETILFIKDKHVSKTTLFNLFIEESKDGKNKKENLISLSKLFEVLNYSIKMH